jgi:hypothetical protein
MKTASPRRHIVGLALTLTALTVLFSPPTTREARAAVVAESYAPLHGAVRAFRSVDDGPVGVRASSDFPPAAAPTLGLTMADFTGDTHPDLATLELDRIDAAHAHYSIEIQLTEGRSQTVTLTAPFGGLTITAMDVTGDGNLDLVIHAATSRSLVAVLLNDGTGHFDNANNVAFAALAGDDPNSVRCTEEPVYLGATLGCPETHVVAHPHRTLRPLLEKNRLIIRPSYEATGRQYFPVNSNRAPPSLG